MNIQKLYFFAFIILLISCEESLAGAVDPSLKTPEELLRQQNLDAIQQQRRMELMRQLEGQQQTNPDVRNDLKSIRQSGQAASLEFPENESPCFAINRLEITGEEAHKFNFALDSVLSKPDEVLNKCLGVNGINAIANRLQNVILAQGFITSRVLLAPQDLKKGVLQLTVIPGRIGNIRLTPDSSRYISPSLALPMAAGDILNLRDIEQGLENLKRVPTAEVNFQIEPSNLDKPGYSDLVIDYRQKFPVRISVGLDDSGLNSTGKYIAGTTVSLDNALALSDLLYVNYNHDIGGGDSGSRGVKGYNAYYAFPVGNWMFSASASGNDYHQEVAGASQNYTYSGTSKNAEIKINYLVYRNSINKTNLSLRGFLRKSYNYIDDTEIENQRRRTAGWELGFNQSWYLGPAIVDYSLAYRRGTGAMNALKAPEEWVGEGTSRMKMLQWDLNALMPFTVNLPWGAQPVQYSANIRGQMNYTPLTPQDRFAIGNRFTVRGFDGQQILMADRGWLIRNELSTPISSSGHSVYWGLDYPPQRIV